jgi:hypothetical protein
MKKQLLIIGITVALLSVGLSGCLGSVSKEFSSEYEANENTVLKVTNINGNVEITSWDGNAVTLNAETRSNQGNDELDKIQIDVVESNNVIDIETTFLGTGSVEATTDITIKVPTFVTVDTITTSNGEIQISNTKGNVTAVSSNKAIIIENVDGYVKATTSNRRIEIKGTTGIRDLHTSNEGIYAEIYDFQENISIRTSNDRITLYINPSLNANVTITTSNGQISISGLSLDLTTSEKTYKSGKLGEGGNRISIHTSNSDINLYNLEV